MLLLSRLFFVATLKNAPQTLPVINDFFPFPFTAEFIWVHSQRVVVHPKEEKD
jgi:hypothetical protein